MTATKPKKKKNRARRRKDRTVEAAKSVAKKVKAATEPDKKPLGLGAEMAALSLRDLQDMGIVSYDAVEPRQP